MTTRTLTVGYIPGSYPPRSLIRISGLWLAQAGFQVADRIIVTVSFEHLIVNKLKPEGSEPRDELENTTHPVTDIIR